MFNELLSQNKGRNTSGRKRMKCNFVGSNSAAGNCRKCGDPAEPGAKKLCIDCTIEAGANPVVTPPAAPEKKDTE
jgi:hypothetical protein